MTYIFMTITVNRHRAPEGLFVKMNFRVGDYSRGAYSERGA